jgi:predicted nucleic acid-binding Zn ribbon protein
MTPDPSEGSGPLEPKSETKPEIAPDARQSDKLRPWQARTLRAWLGFDPPKDPAHRQFTTKQLVGRFLKKHRLEQQWREEDIARHWAEVVGEFNAQYSRPLSFRQGVLIIAVTNASALHVISRQKAALQAKLQERLGPQTVIKNLIFRGG